MALEGIGGLLGGVDIGWRDLLDIAVVTFIIYEFLKLIRRTQAIQVVFGGVLVVGLYYVSESASLRTVNWIIGDMFGYVVIAAIVLFQADIRRGLARLGQAPFVRYLSRHDTTGETLAEVAMVARELSSRQVGAIIAIERDIGLRNYVESGIPLDARVNYDLLVSIFLTDSLLHDGAVIVQEDRIAAASCFLPLTVQPQRTRLGTRHRAAIGLTEESDAVAVVVSEESGAVSLAVDGELEREVDPDRLAERLEQLVQPGRRARPVSTTDEVA